MVGPEGLKPSTNGLSVLHLLYLGG
ncbi:uncharacterized protein METZ01_LOCUS286022, partial [marine metagenome]